MAVGINQLWVEGIVTWDCSREGTQCKLQGCTLVAKRCCTRNRWSESLFCVKKRSCFTLKLRKLSAILETFHCSTNILNQFSGFWNLCLLCWRMHLCFCFSEFPRGRYCSDASVCSPWQIAAPSQLFLDIQEGNHQRARIHGVTASCLRHDACFSEPCKPSNSVSDGFSLQTIQEPHSWSYAGLSSTLVLKCFQGLLERVPRRDWHGMAGGPHIISMKY